MKKQWNQHIGDDQLIQGMPKHMVGVSTVESSSKRFDPIPGDPSYNPPSEKPDKVTFWTVHPKPKACDKCQEMEGIKYWEKPERPHPNCKCDIRKHEYKPGKRTIVGTFTERSTESFAGLGSIDIELTNLGVALAPAVRITTNLDGDQGSHVPLGIPQHFDFNIFIDTHVNWEIDFEVHAEGTRIQYVIEYEM